MTAALIINSNSFFGPLYTRAIYDERLQELRRGIAECDSDKTTIIGMAGVSRSYDLMSTANQLFGRYAREYGVTVELRWYQLLGGSPLSLERHTLTGSPASGRSIQATIFPMEYFWEFDEFNQLPAWLTMLREHLGVEPINPTGNLAFDLQGVRSVTNCRSGCAHPFNEIIMMFGNNSDDMFRRLPVACKMED